MIRALLIVIALLGVLCIWQRGSLANAQRTAEAAERARDAMEDERDAARASLAQTRAALETERKNLAAVNKIAARYEQDKAHAQAAHDALVADLRAGNRRLHDRWQAALATAGLSADVAAAALADAAADDRHQSAGRIVRAADEADAQIAGLQSFALLCSGASEEPTP